MTDLYDDAVFNSLNRLTWNMTWVITSAILPAVSAKIQNVPPSGNFKSLFIFWVWEILILS